jgi:hypothetical protein
MGHPSEVEVAAVYLAVVGSAEGNQVGEQLVSDARVGDVMKVKGVTSPAEHAPP